MAILAPILIVQNNPKTLAVCDSVLDLPDYLLANLRAETDRLKQVAEKQARPGSLGD